MSSQLLLVIDIFNIFSVILLSRACALWNNNLYVACALIMTLGVIEVSGGLILDAYMDSMTCE